MSHLIHTQNCLTAWRDACNHVINNGDGFNLLVQINQPLLINQNHLDEIVNSDIISNQALQDVINTIFPHKLYRRNLVIPINQFYDLHERIYLRGKTMHKKNRAKWGNYFLRFTRFGDNRENQIQKIITDINNRPNNQAACYLMHVSSIDYDSNTRIIANPCLQYVQFGQYNNSLNLTAIYRNHDFLTKALGNYIGLSRLLEFVCNQTNSQVGSVTCHSIHYYLHQKRKVRNCFTNLTW